MEIKSVIAFGHAISILNANYWQLFVSTALKIVLQDKRFSLHISDGWHHFFIIIIPNN